mmetsp:Transcript_311/g.807  ORF Transcript_311/g.807 Transcript_311/m.807 type:complete len:132 (-) Transcript_311:94-489(-)
MHSAQPVFGASAFAGAAEALNILHRRPPQEWLAHGVVMQQPQAEIAPGRCVQIVGLVQAAQFNGRWGMVEDYDPNFHRFTVRISMGPGDPLSPAAEGQWERAKVHRDNLIPLPTSVQTRQAYPQQHPHYTV